VSERGGREGGASASARRVTDRERARGGVPVAAGHGHDVTRVRARLELDLVRDLKAPSVARFGGGHVMRCEVRRNGRP
jgi:hypothetical protein